MHDEYLIQENGQLKAVSNPVRMQMLQLLTEHTLTATQLGRQMGIAPARAHYHLKQLETAGLVELVEVRENSSILEKYYSAIAKLFRLDRTVTHDPTGEKSRQSELHTTIESTTRGFEQRLQEHGAEIGAMDSDLLFQVLTLHLTAQRHDRMLARLRALLLEFAGEDRGARPGTAPYKLMLLAYPEQGPETGHNGAGPNSH